MKRNVMSILILLVAISTSLFGQEKGSGVSDDYAWLDSDEVNGPVYGWFEISLIGTELTMIDDEESSPFINMGMSFEYYGASYDTVKVFPNGYLSFTDNLESFDIESIPNVSRPNGIIAPFRNDLDPGSQGAVYYYYDSSNSRFIVQYENVPVYGESAGNTFQVILDASGEILFQYKSMNGTLNACVIGVENQDGTKGLQVVYCSTYVKDSLSVQISPTAESNDGTFVLTPDSLAYGNVTLGDTSIKSFTISNTHESETMAGTITTISGYTVTESLTKEKGGSAKNFLEYTIGPNSSINYDLEFVPSAVEDYSGSILITSSDTSHPQDSVHVSGAGVIPDISVSQTDTLRAQVNQGSTVNKNFSVLNGDDGELHYNISCNFLSSDIYKGEGGPDVFGYFWKDSDDPTGPVYTWYDISGLGTPLSMLDQQLYYVNFGFDFDFYGNTYSGANISSNGYLTFGSYNMDYATSLPDAELPNDIICPYWTDLDPSVQGMIYYYFDSANQRFIVQYDNIAHYGTTSNNTFQVILYADNVIEFQYKYATDSRYTVGIENSAGTVATLIAFDPVTTTYLKNSFAVRFRPVPQWLSIDPAQGDVLPYESDVISTVFDSQGLMLGDHYATININSNDPDTPSIAVPVKFTVYELTSPVNFTASAAGSVLTLDWDDVPYATGYKIYSSDDPYGSFTEDTGGVFTGSSWSVSITASKKFYKVAAADAK